MYIFLYRELINRLDRLSTKVNTSTFYFGDPDLTPGYAVRSVVKDVAFALAVLLLIAAATLWSRGLQYEIMTQNLGAFFLPGLKLVSTTADSGFFMLQAQHAKEAIASGVSSIELALGGKLPGLTVALISSSLDASLEDSARWLLYFGVILSCFSCYLFFCSLGQRYLGALTSLALVFVWPFFSRTSVGMLDTDTFNLFFFLSILTCLNVSASSIRPAFVIALAIAAGVLFQVFMLWYPYRGFLIPFLVTYILLALSNPRRVWSKFIGLLAFSLPAEPWNSWGNLASFLETYVINRASGQAVEATSGVTVSELRARVYSTISEAADLSSGMIVNDFGSVYALILSFCGIALWFLQGWRRAIASIPLLAFGALYLFSGPRFAFYFSPLFLAGLMLLIANFLWLILRGLRVSVMVEHPSPIGLESPSQQSPAKSFGQRSWLVHRSLLGLAALGSLWPIGVLPSLIIAPPPVISASEMLTLRKVIDNHNVPNVFVASLWDYGYEIRYQTGRTPLTDGGGESGGPGSIKVIYIGRALISDDPYYSADEIRFSAYFRQEQLANYYPRRPPLSVASNLDRDILVFLPSTLQTKMDEVYRITEDLLPISMQQGYDPKRSVFYRLYHETPNSLGPFQLLASDASGARVYLLRSPK